jgi:hypothetical protein
MRVRPAHSAKWRCRNAQTPISVGVLRGNSSVVRVMNLSINPESRSLVAVERTRCSEKESKKKERNLTQLHQVFSSANELLVSFGVVRMLVVSNRLVNKTLPANFPATACGSGLSRFEMPFSTLPTGLNGLR